MLVVDVGTNAEIQLGDKSGFRACSSPTGPAFERRAIFLGQRAAPGAIERVEIAGPLSGRAQGDRCDLWSDDAPSPEAVAATRAVTGNLRFGDHTRRSRKNAHGPGSSELPAELIGLRPSRPARDRISSPMAGHGGYLVWAALRPAVRPFITVHQPR